MIHTFRNIIVNELFYLWRISGFNVDFSREFICMIIKEFGWFFEKSLPALSGSATPASGNTNLNYRILKNTIIIKTNTLRAKKWNVLQQIYNISRKNAAESDTSSVPLKCETFTPSLFVFFGLFSPIHNILLQIYSSGF
jgi:hypothetical protein